MVRPIFLTHSKKDDHFYHHRQSHDFVGLWVIVQCFRPSKKRTINFIWWSVVVQFFRPSQKKVDHFYHLSIIYYFYWLFQFFWPSQNSYQFFTIHKVTILLVYESSSNVLDPLKKRTIYFIWLSVVVQFFRPSHKKDDHFIIIIAFKI